MRASGYGALVAALLFTQASAPRAVAQDAASWTVAIYMIGDDPGPNLEASQVATLRAMAAAPRTPGVRYVAQLDRGEDRSDPRVRDGELGSTGSGATRYVLEATGWRAVEELGEIDGSTPESLADFLRWADRTAPAVHRTLWIDGHGGGVTPGGDVPWGWLFPAVPEMDSESEGTFSMEEWISAIAELPPIEPTPGPFGIPVPVDEPGAAPADTSGGPLPVPHRPPVPTRTINSEGAQGTSLTFGEFRTVLRRHRMATGKRFEVVFLYACLGGSLEAAYELRHEVDYLAGSGGLMQMGDGIAPLASTFARNPEISPRALARALVRGYEEASTRFLSQPVGGPGGVPVEGVDPGGDMIQAWDLRQVRRVARAADRLARVGIRALETPGHEGPPGLWEKAAEAFHPYYYDGLFRRYLDLAQLARAMATSPPFGRGPLAAEVRDASADVLRSLERAMVAGAKTGTWATRGHQVGLSVFFPLHPTDASVRQEYRQLEFGKKSRWMEFVDMVHEKLRSITPSEAALYGSDVEPLPELLEFPELPEYPGLSELPSYPSLPGLPGGAGPGADGAGGPAGQEGVPAWLIQALEAPITPEK